MRIMLKGGEILNTAFTFPIRTWYTDSISWDSIPVTLGHIDHADIFLFSYQGGIL